MLIMHSTSNFTLDGFLASTPSPNVPFTPPNQASILLRRVYPDSIAHYLVFSHLSFGVRLLNAS